MIADLIPHRLLVGLFRATQDVSPLLCSHLYVWIADYLLLCITPTYFTRCHFHFFHWLCKPAGFRHGL